MPSTEISLLEKVAKALKELGKELSVDEQRHLMSSMEVSLQTVGNPSIYKAKVLELELPCISIHAKWWLLQ